MSQIDYLWRLKEDFPGHTFTTVDIIKSDTRYQLLWVDGKASTLQWSRPNRMIPMEFHGKQGSDQEKFYYRLRLNVDALLKQRR